MTHLPAEYQIERNLQKSNHSFGFVMFDHSRGLARRVYIRLRRRAWLSAMRRAGVSIHPSIELVGAPPPYTGFTLGSGTRLERDVTVGLVHEPGSNPILTIGRDVYIGRNTYMSAYMPLTIGDFTLIGAYCYLISSNHRFDDRTRPIRDQGNTGAPIVLGRDVWLGTHVVVLPGVTIADGAIIAAGSVVNRNVPEFEIWGGTPARFLKARP